MLNKDNNSSYTIAVDSMVNAISGGSPNKPSLYQQAADYFKSESETKNRSNDETLTLQANRLARLNDAIDVCLDILALSEGETFAETQNKARNF